MELAVKSDAGTHRTPKALPATAGRQCKIHEQLCSVSRKLWSALPAAASRSDAGVAHASSPSLLIPELGKRFAPDDR